MSRIIVKNLPKRVKEERVRTIFSQKGYITDCSLKYTPDGVFRRFAFIGYKTAAEAEAAQKHFDQTYIDTSKLQVEIAKDLGDLSKPRAWSKYSKDSSAYQQLQEKDGESDQQKPEKETSTDKNKSKPEQKSKLDRAERLLGELKDDPQFKEFLAAHKNRGQKALWTDDSAVMTSVAADGDSDEDGDEARLAEASDSSEESDCEEEHEETEVPVKVSDKDYLRSKVVTKLLSSSSEDSDSDANDSDVDMSDTDASDSDQETQQDKEMKPDKTAAAGETQSTSDAQESLMEPLYHYIIKMRGLPVNITEAQIVSFFKPLKTSSIKIPRNPKGKDMRLATVNFDSEADLEKAAGRNKNFIGKNKIFLHKTKEKVEAVTKKFRPWEQKQEEEVERIDESGRLYIRNLSYSCQEEDIESLFSTFGPLTEVHLPVDGFTKKIKGFAFVTFMMPEHAMKAYTELDGKDHQGRLLHILPAHPKKDQDEEITDSMSFKKKKELKQKKTASSSHNWNSLFLGANAVADVIAEKYGTTKDKVLDAESSQSLGVRLALGETQIVAETRQFLVDEGVALDAFSQAAAARSKTVMLVKNLPARTKAEDLEKIFSKHGTLGRLLLPPSGVTGIVEYADPTEAKGAFRSLAYTKYQHIPLYLEWAPVGVFTTAPPPPEEKTPDPDTKESETVTENPDEDQNQTEPEVEQPTTSNPESSKPDISESTTEQSDATETEQESSVFVKNLNFKTNEDDMMELFKKCGPVHKVSIAKKKDLKNPGNMLSMGYGFVEYKYKKSAEKAIKKLQHAKLDDHDLELKMSTRNTVQKPDGTSVKKGQEDKKQTGTKILVRNVPFEATIKEIQELFSVFGELKFVRLPKKLQGAGSHRGFGFVDFLTKNDAKRAFNTLCHSTHLYGRRLVLEWAEADDTIDDLRKKTARNYHNEPAQKRLKKSGLMDELKGTS